jgi:dUTP pyrophosphatase
MKVKIKRIDKTLPLPKYESSGACCFDLLAREQRVIPSHSLGLIPTNIIVQVPEGYMFIVLPRSSTAKKKGLIIPHGLGIIDQDYHGPDDEVIFQVYNVTEEDVVVEKGERLAQGCFIPVAKVSLIEEEIENKKSRGGIGSTG